ncbi:mitochondrial glycoprotein [Mycena belliarum]|uniref:Mitochondrial glycoprotein n=1 Tax=Mycena belliarum TaxID=1033014 RepID=A0AAD6TYR1_9AGAR|nr:mitochondrial glycoprotein [Mycena belliae]
MSAARSLRQLTTAASRISSRQFSSASLFGLSVVAKKAAQVPATSRAFSVSARSLKAGSSDVALVQKLSEELKYEVEENANAEVPQCLTAFESQGIWKIQDEPGNNEVVFTRQFGNENIRLVFSVTDLHNQDPQEDFEREEDAEEEPPTGDVLRVVVSITKSTGPGAVELDMSCQNGQFLIENIAFYEDAKLGRDTGLEADWKRRGLYIGPEFSTLDVAVQEQFEKFLEERDLGESTAFSLPEYAAYKEQKEYVRWLNNVKGFIGA